MSPRRPYGFERRQKESARRAKQEAKRKRKSDRAREGSVGPEIDGPQEPSAQPNLWEWFSPSRSRVATSKPGTRPADDLPDDWVLLTDVGEGAGEPQ